MIELKHTSKDDKEHCGYPYHITCIQRRTITTKRRWVQGKLSRSKGTVVSDNPSSIPKFNRLFGKVRHFRLTDLTRDYSHDIGIPGIEDSNRAMTFFCLGFFSRKFKNHSTAG